MRLPHQGGPVTCSFHPWRTCSWRPSVALVSVDQRPLAGSLPSKAAGLFLTHGAVSRRHAQCETISFPCLSPELNGWGCKQQVGGGCGLPGEKLLDWPCSSCHQRQLPMGTGHSLLVLAVMEKLSLKCWMTQKQTVYTVIRKFCTSLQRLWLVLSGNANNILFHISWNHWENLPSCATSLFKALNHNIPLWKQFPSYQKAGSPKIQTSI